MGTVAEGNSASTGIPLDHLSELAETLQSVTDMFTGYFKIEGGQIELTDDQCRITITWANNDWAVRINPKVREVRS